MELTCSILFFAKDFQSHYTLMDKPINDWLWI